MHFPQPVKTPVTNTEIKLLHSKGRSTSLQQSYLNLGNIPDKISSLSAGLIVAFIVLRSTFRLNREQT